MNKFLAISLALTSTVLLLNVDLANAAANSTTKTSVTTQNSLIINTNAVYRDDRVIKEAISKYKAKNYAGCISDLRIYTEKDPNSAIAWYYLGNSYMNIAMQQDAYAAYDKVIALNSVPKLTSYAIQAELCMQNRENCMYKDFTQDEIKALKSNPSAFLQAYNEKQVVQKKDKNTEEIETLIKGGYPYNIHPDAKQFIEQERTKIKQTQINDRV